MSVCRGHELANALYVYQPPSLSISLTFYGIFRWAECASLNTGRSAFALEWVTDGRLFAVGGKDGPASLLATVEMLECPWDTEKPVNSEWRYVAPMHHTRVGHATAYFEGKLIAAGGYEQDTVECFTLPTDELPDGQWVIIRPMVHVNTLFGILPFGENLLFVGKCTVCLFSTWHDCFILSRSRLGFFRYAFLLHKKVACE